MGEEPKTVFIVKLTFLLSFPLTQFNSQSGTKTLKELSDIPKNYANKIADSIDSLAFSPRPNGCKKLKGSSNLYRIRIADYRIIYSIEDNILFIELIRIAHRSKVYE